MRLVDPEITRRKLDREIELWRESAEVYRRRGWILLERRDEVVDVAFVGRLPLGQQVVPVISACVRLDYTNYDLWPPAVEFIDPASGEFAPPPVPAIVPTPEGPRNLLVGSHPHTGRPFFCVPGVRQYHDHPQHSGDSWLLHRASGAGSLATVCERIWTSMVRNLVGLQVGVITLPPGSPQQAQLQVNLVTGDIDALDSGEPPQLFGSVPSG